MSAAHCDFIFDYSQWRCTLQENLYNFILCYEYCIVVSFISIRHRSICKSLSNCNNCLHYLHSQPTYHAHKWMRAMIERKLNKLSCSEAKFCKFEIPFGLISLTHQMHCEESLTRARKIPNCANKFNASAGEYNYTLKLILDLNCFDFGCDDSLL